ncbi:metallophosphoesterase family protein [soil metagenome]
MFGFFKRQPQPVRIPDDCVVWAVGDVHGRADLLGALLAEIRADLDRSNLSRRIVVMLGDYVDRGAESRRVLDILSDLSVVSELETHFLWGNHEDRFLAFMSEPLTGPSWCDFGGRETLWSYGIQAPSPRAAEQDWIEAARAMSAALPETHRRFLSQLEWSFELGGYFFAHAGARPGVTLSDQAERDLIWIRAEFLDGRKAFERMVVHGHTPESEIQNDHRRIGLDTGAYATGVLSGLRLEGTRRSVLQTSVRGDRIAVVRADI